MPIEPARTTEAGFGITAIDTDYVRPGLDASHLISAAGRAAFVDTGTNASVPLLLNALERAGHDRGDVDYVFLTHVHLDHAGGAGLLMQHLPNARAVIHPRGARHMIDPARLIEGSVAVYGEAVFRRLYGQLEPVNESCVIIAEDGQVFDVGNRRLRVLHTEGHARHHYCLHDPTASAVFTGDSFGISYREFDTVNGEFIYPTTTPVHFDPPEAHRAIDRIVSFAPERLFLTHYSLVTSVDRLAGDMHRRIDDFVELACAHAGREDRTARMRDAMYVYLLDALRAHGCGQSDEELRALAKMDVELNVMGLEYWLDSR